jgi:hypothetical protein
LLANEASASAIALFASKLAPTGGHVADAELQVSGISEQLDSLPRAG